MTTEVSRRSLAALGIGAIAAAGVSEEVLAQGVGAMNSAALARGNWMEQVQAQHKAIDAAFQRTKAQTSVGTMTREFRALNAMLAAHSIAEEVVLYPGIDQKVGDPQFKKASGDQQEAKVLANRIDNALAMGDLNTARTTLATLEAAIKAHVAEEEQQYYPALMRASNKMMNDKMSQDFKMFFTKAIA